MAPFFDSNGDPNLNPYTVLNLPQSASDADVKKAYRTQMLQLHPDKLSPDLTEAEIAAVTEKFHNVKDAYEFLISPQYLTARRLYQAKMASQRAEFERREAFLRRANFSSGATNAASGMYTHGHARNGSFPMHYGAPSSRPSRGGERQHHGNQPNYNYGNRSKSEPRYDPAANGGRPSQRQQQPRRPERSGGVGQPRHYKGGNVGRAAEAPAGGGKTSRRDSNKRRSGYVSDEQKRRDSSRQPNKTNRRGSTSGREENPRGTTAKESSGRRKMERGRTHGSSHDRTNSNKNHQRAKSEPRKERRRSRERASSGGNGGSGSSTDSNDDRVRFEGNNRPYKKSSSNYGNSPKSSSDKKNSSSYDKRRRAKSAPPRYSGGRDTDRDRFNSNSRDRSSSKNRSEKINNTNTDSKSTPEFYCPLTKRIMKDPVIDLDGNSYEREAIERWLRVQSSSPITNGNLCMEDLKPNRELKARIQKVVGKPRSKSQPRARSRSKTRCSSPSTLVSGRILIDSYLREISKKSKLSVSLDGMGICAFSYRRTTFVIEVPITPGGGFMVYSSFDAADDQEISIQQKIDAWNKWLATVGCGSRVSYVKAGNKSVFTLKGSEKEMTKCDVFQKTLEYFVEMSLKLHNLLHPTETKNIDNVCLTRAPVAVA
mmetsp:Transcript_31586/g.64461  ORF Transcript_31586/g.64461 Transcript_31586/m.64461 type:complete len:654 (+) Transcript_31586:488-2449(+)